MKVEDELTILAHTQFVARFYMALKCPLSKMVELIRHSIGSSTPPAEAVELFLRKESTRDKLEQAFETALFESSDRNRTWRLICLATPTDVETCKERLGKKLPSQDACAFCWISEYGHDREMFKPELDPYQNPVPGIYLHRNCIRSWRRMRNIVERNSK